MAKNLEITEYHNLVTPQLIDNAMSLIQDMKDSNRKPGLKATLDATHSGRLTNLRVYPGKRMRDGASTFVKPYGKPFLRHHNEDNDPIGRVTSSDYIQTKFGKDWDEDYTDPKDDLGSGFIRLGVIVNDTDAIEKIVDGRYKTVSVGMAPTTWLCSVCGDYIVGGSDSECEHFPGKTYRIRNSDNDSGKEYLCYAITGPLTYKEISVVNMPGDSFAEITAINVDSADSIKLSSYDKVNMDVGALMLTDGISEVPLIRSSIKEQVTANDRQKLTGKTIVAVSPKFRKDKIESLANEETTMKENTKETTVAATASNGDSTTTQANQDKGKSEGVIASDKAKSDTKEVVKGVDSEKVDRIALQAMADSLEASQTEATEAKAELERSKASLKDKEVELDKLRKDLTTVMADLKQSYAHNLLSAQMMLKKPTVVGIKDEESFNVKLNEYAARTTESLQDSLKDLAPELTSLRENLGLKTTATLVSQDKMDNPVANKTADVKDKSDQLSTKEVVTSYFDN